MYQVLSHAIVKMVIIRQKKIQVLVNVEISNNLDINYIKDLLWCIELDHFTCMLSNTAYCLNETTEHLQGHTYGLRLKLQNHKIC